MDLNEIVVFAKVVETGGFTAAAAALGLPKSTVSRKVAQLEERLDARLLQRSSRKLGLTEVGRAYYERCQRIVADIAAAEQLVADLQESPRGLLRVTAPVDVGGQYLGGLIAEFLAGQPEIAVELLLTDRVVDLIEERLDLGVRFGPLPDSNLVARRLGGIRTYLVASPAYLARRGAPAHPDDLAAHDLVGFVPVSRLRRWRLAGPRGMRVELSLPGRLTTNGMFAVRDAVRAGLGITLLGDFAVAEDLAAGRLARVLPGWHGDDGELFAVYPSTRNASPKLKAFLAFLAARLSPPPWAGAEAPAPRPRGAARRAAGV
jgi:DNA-binding transcriptional LysR family regulator